MAKYYESREWLHRRYVIQKKGIVEIAKECGVGTTTIQRWLEKHGLIRNKRTWKKH
jgi:hypothetical protein